MTKNDLHFFFFFLFFIFSFFIVTYLSLVTGGDLIPLAAVGNDHPPEGSSPSASCEEKWEGCLRGRGKRKGKEAHIFLVSGRVRATRPPKTKRME